MVTSSLVNKFIAARPQGSSPNTIAFYHTTLGKLIGYPLTSEGIQSFLSDLPCHNGKSNYFIAVRAFTNWLVKREYLAVNPITNVPQPKVEKKLLPSLTAAEVDTIIEKAACLRDRALVALAFSSGLRLAELARITVGDVNIENMTIRVTVKGNREAKAVFDKRTKKLLEAYLDGRQGSLFELKPRGIQTLLSSLSETTGIKFSCHSFRRAFASHLRRQGLDVSHIMTLGHWSSLDMPLSYSQSVSFEDSQKLYQAVVS